MCLHNCNSFSSYPNIKDVQLTEGFMGYRIGNMVSAVPSRILEGVLEVNTLIDGIARINLKDYLGTGDWDFFTPVVYDVICNVVTTGYKVTIYRNGMVLVTLQDNTLYDYFECNLSEVNSKDVDIVRSTGIREYAISDVTLTPARNMWANDMVCRANLITNIKMSRIIIEDTVKLMLYEIDLSNHLNDDLIHNYITDMSDIHPIWVRTIECEDGVKDVNGYYWTNDIRSDGRLEGKVMGKVIQRGMLDRRFRGCFFET